MNHQDILHIAMKQSALDLNCDPEDFLRSKPVIVKSDLSPRARKYYQEPIAGILVSYGHNIVASVKDEYHEIVSEFINKFEFYRCFETPNLYWLDNRLSALGQRVCFMAEYYLPDPGKLKLLPCEYRLDMLSDFSSLYQPEWSNALCEDRKSLDILGVGAYEGTTLVGLAGCSADCDTMWQIGVDVLPEYRRKGVAAALTSRLAVETWQRNKVPFYCSAWSNLPSVRNAVKSGFVPAWVEMTIKPADIVAGMNQ